MHDEEERRRGEENRTEGRYLDGTPRGGGARRTLRHAMEASEGIHIVAEGAIDHLRDLQRTLRTAGIEAQITSPPAAKCSS